MWKFKLFLHLSSISHHKTSLNVLMYPTSSSISSRMYLKLTTNGRTDIEVGLQKRFWHLPLGWLGSTCSSLQTVLSKYSLLADTTWSFSSAISMTSTNLLSSAIMKGLKQQNRHTTHTTKVTSILPDWQLEFKLFDGVPKRKWIKLLVPSARRGWARRRVRVRGAVLCCSLVAEKFKFATSASKIC